MIINRYIPIIKTTDAEIKGYRYLSSETKKLILPLFELTRSRPIKGYPEGDIYKRMSQIEDYAEGNPFILDLTRHEDLANSQIESLLDDKNGFHEWREFLNAYSHLNIIPMLHLYPDYLDSYIKFAELSKEKFDNFAFRVGLETSSDELLTYLSSIEKVLDLKNQLLFIIDAEYVDNKSMDQVLISACRLARVAHEKGIRNVSINSSSFPSSVAPYGDASGEIDMLEVSLYKGLKAAFFEENLSVIYGDYAGIHPLRYNVMGGSWVPRVDLTLDSKYVFKRFRRDDGGYIRAASEMMRSPWYNPVESWAKQQIEKAGQGEPEGKSPAFWISVRLNQHISRLSKLAINF